MWLCDEVRIYCKVCAKGMDWEEYLIFWLPFTVMTLQYLTNYIQCALTTMPWYGIMYRVRTLSWQWHNVLCQWQWKRWRQWHNEKQIWTEQAGCRLLEQSVEVFHGYGCQAPWPSVMVHYTMLVSHVTLCLYRMSLHACIAHYFMPQSCPRPSVTSLQSVCVCVPAQQTSVWKSSLFIFSVYLWTIIATAI